MKNTVGQALGQEFSMSYANSACFCGITPQKQWDKRWGRICAKRPQNTVNKHSCPTSHVPRGPGRGTSSGFGDTHEY